MFEIVHDKILYQATNWDYKIGQKIYFGEKFNNQAFRATAKKITMKNGENALIWLWNKSQNKNKLNASETKEIANAMMDYAFTVRELSMEYCRQKYYKDYPSRLTCMFLCETKEEAEKYVSSCKYKNDGSKGFVIKVKLDGKLFKTSNKINRRDITFMEGIEQAHKYWQGVDKNYKDDSVEFLFEGTAEIVDVIE